MRNSVLAYLAAGVVGLSVAGTSQAWFRHNKSCAPAPDCAAPCAAPAPAYATQLVTMYRMEQFIITFIARP